jgi:hypothetical protein
MGETAHVERWNNTLRQRLARFVRKTLSFAKDPEMHEACLNLFLHRYNRCRGSPCFPELLPLLVLPTEWNDAVHSGGRREKGCHKHKAYSVSCTNLERNSYPYL